MRYPWRVSLALLVSFWLLLLPWCQLTVDHNTLIGSALTASAMLLGGVLFERLPVAVNCVAQAGIGVAGIATTVAFGYGPDAVADLPGALVRSARFMQLAGEPAQRDPGVAFLLVAAVATLALLAHGLAVPTRRPALGVVPLVALYLAPVTLLNAPMAPLGFWMLAVSVVAVLWAGSALPHGGIRARVAALATTLGIGVVALGLTFALVPILPQPEPPRAPEPLQMNDPSVDLKRNLVQDSDEVLLTYSTDAKNGTYLKLATLPAYSSNGFALSKVRVGSGRIPAIPGNPRGQQRTTHVRIAAFRSEWLPVPYAPQRIDAPGEWGFALDTLDMMALNRPDRGTATQGISYSVTSLDVSASQEVITGASSKDAPQRDLNTGVPGVPDEIRRLAEQLTLGKTTSGAKVQALQDYLLSGRFTYSTSPSVGDGDGVSTIMDFLFTSHSGYCEQFAGAMTLMARELGIPARLAVGFVPGTRVGDDWQVTAKDLHTWPEIWLDGLGWTAFEPTPPRGEVGSQNIGSSAPVVQPPAQKTAVPQTSPSQEPGSQETASPEPARADAVDQSPPVGLWLGLLAAGIAVVASGLAAWFAPGWLRSRRREARLAGTGNARADTIAAWDEVRDTVADLKLPWSQGSPRYAAKQLTLRLGENQEALAALSKLAAAAERALYDRSYDGECGWRDEVLAISGALAASIASGRRAAPRRAA